MKKSPAKLLNTIKTLLMFGLIISCVSCAARRSKVIALSSDRIAIRLQRGAKFQAATDGWFLPDALWVDINKALEDKIKP